MTIFKRNLTFLSILLLFNFYSCKRVSLQDNLGFDFKMDSVAKYNKFVELIKDGSIKKVKGVYVLTWNIPNLDSAIQSKIYTEFNTYERELNHLNTIKLHLMRDTIFVNHFYPFSNNEKNKEEGYWDTVLHCPIDINALINIERALTNYLGKPDSILGSLKKIELNKQNKIEVETIDLQRLKRQFNEKRFDENCYLENQLYGSFDRINSKKVIWKKKDKIIIFDYSNSINDGPRIRDSKTGKYRILFGPLVNEGMDLFHRYRDSYETNKWYSYPTITIVSSSYFDEVYELRKKKRSLMKVEDYCSIKIDNGNSRISRINNSNQFKLKICLSEIYNKQIYNPMPISAIKFKFAIYDKFDELINDTDDFEYDFRQNLEINMAETNYFGGWCYEVLLKSKRELNIENYINLEKEFFQKEIKIKPIIEAIVFRDGTVLKSK